MTDETPNDRRLQPDDEVFDKAYDTFVRSENDVEGLLAYAFCKRHERDWFINHRAEEKKNPTPSERRAFVNSVITSESQYHHEAVNALMAFAEAIVQDRRRDIERQAIEGRIESATGFWKTVISSIIGFFVVSLLLIMIAFIAQFLGIDLLEALNVSPRQ